MEVGGGLRRHLQPATSGHDPSLNEPLEDFI